MRYSIIVLCMMNVGCASLATSMATQVGVQVVGEQYLIAKNKPIIRCNVFNMIQHNKMCRVYKLYRKA